MIDYVYDFLSILFAKVKIDKIKSIILFGSIARGDNRKNSDIDIFIDVSIKDKKEIEKNVKESLNEFEVKSEKSWNLRGINNAIQPIVDDLSMKKWDELRNEIKLYGKLLFGNFSASNKKKSSIVLINYEISKLKQKDKMKIIRALYGYKNKINGKLYQSKGVLHEYGGEKVESGILLPIENHRKLLEFLRDNKIPVKIKIFQT